MTLPPSILRLRMRTRDRRFGLWFPIIAVWPLAALLILVASPLVVIFAIILWPVGWGKPLLLAVPLLVRLFCALRGLEIRVEKPSEQVFISFL